MSDNSTNINHKGKAQSLKTNLLSETTVSQAQPAFICLNLAILTAE